MQGLWGVLWLPEAALGQILPVGDKRQFCCNSGVELEDHLGMDSEQTEYFLFFNRSGIREGRGRLSNDNEFVELCIIVSG